MQHGVALTKEEDPERPLTTAGRRAVDDVAARAGSAGVHVDVVLHSDLLRAEQTARILADAVGAQEVKTQRGLRPADPVAPVAAELDRIDAESVAVVGHLPFLDRLAALLVAEDEQAQVLRFHNAALVRLVPKDEADGYRVDWVLVPELA